MSGKTASSKDVIEVRAEAEVRVDTVVRCTECSDDLTHYHDSFDAFGSESPGFDLGIEVEPCETCLEQAAKERAAELGGQKWETIRRQINRLAFYFDNERDQFDCVDDLLTWAGSVVVSAQDRVEGWHALRPQLERLFPALDQAGPVGSARDWADRLAKLDPPPAPGPAEPATEQEARAAIADALDTWARLVLQRHRDEDHITPTEVPAGEPIEIEVGGGI